MRHVYQLDEYGCGYAVAAMVAGKDYFTVRRIAHKIVPRTLNKSFDIRLTLKELQKLLKYFNIKSYISKKRNAKDFINNNLIIVLKFNDKDKTRHYVVYDAKKQTIYDPWPIEEENAGNRSDYCVESILVIK